MSENRVFIVDGTRTPFLKAGTEAGAFSAADLAVAAGRPLLARMPFAPAQFDEVVLGCVMPAPEEANVARTAALRLGCGHAVAAHTVQRGGASGLQALATAAERIRLGQAELVLAGGTDAVSRAPILWNPGAVAWLARRARARGPIRRLGVALGFRARYLEPAYSRRLGLTDPLVDLSPGQTAEVLAHLFGISREAQDAWALRSHGRLAAAYDAGDMTGEVEVLYRVNGRFDVHDTSLRRDTDMIRLSKLPPAFDPMCGQVTAGNAAPVADGAAVLVVAGEQAVRRYGLDVLGEWVGHAWAGVDPRQAGLGAAPAVAKLLAHAQVKMRDLAQMELHESFAAQVLACQSAWGSAEYARNELGLDAAPGAVEPARLNPDGGGIACGDPPGASGARVVLHLLLSLKRKRGGLGVAALCAGGGQGGAALVRVPASEAA